MRIQKEELQAVVKQAATVAVTTGAQARAVPILAGVHLECRNGRLVARCTDLETSVRAEGTAEGDLPACVVPVRALGAALKTAPKGAMLEVSPVYPGGVDNPPIIGVRVDSPAGSVSIDCAAPADESPPWPEVAPETLARYSYIATCGELATVATRAAVAMSRDEAWYAVWGAQWAGGHAGWRIVATDGHRLTVQEIGAPDATEPTAEFILPGRALRALASLCRQTGNARKGGAVSLFYRAPVEFRAAKDGRPEVPARAGFIGMAQEGPGGWRMATRPAEGSLPNWSRILPAEEVSAVLEVAGMATAVKAAAVGADPRHHYAVRLAVNGCLTVTREGNRAESAARDYHGPAEGFNVYFNSGYLLDILSTMAGAAEVRMAGPRPSPAGSAGSGPYVWAPVGETGYRHVLMPCRG